jgi:pyruvate/2-oxoglutarate dehydrogenase complex dihydrolipoamide dehydrogenase (E3) component
VKAPDPWPKPARFDRNLVVIGAGAAGLTAAYIAATLKARVTLVEKDRMGGDCLYTGCVPSKSLIRTARLLSDIRRARAFGIAEASARFDFAEVMERVQRVIRQIEPHDSAQRFEGMGVECLRGEATLASPHVVEVRTEGGMRTLATRAIVLATGATPALPTIEGIDAMNALTSETLWSLRRLPGRLLVLGGGPVGCELAQCFARFGSQVTLLESGTRLLSREDPEFSELVRARFVAEGIDVRLAHEARHFLTTNGARSVLARHAGGEVQIPFDTLLCALGRVPNTAGYGIEALGLRTSESGTLKTDAYMQTSHSSIYACGDVAGPYQFTHAASQQAWYATVNALFGRLRRFRPDDTPMPWTTFTDPEVARVGLNQTEAEEKGTAFETTRYCLAELDRAITDEAGEGLVKVLTTPGRDDILGVTIAGERAGELIAEFVAAIKNGIGLNGILGTVHVYPTFVEANRYAAAEWRQAHLPSWALSLMQRYHRWQLG